MNMLLCRLQSKKIRENFGQSESVLSKLICIRIVAYMKSSREIKILVSMYGRGYKSSPKAVVGAYYIIRIVLSISKNQKLQQP